ncbi:MAG: Hsp20/alpha crystallin family protein [Ectothiorhodospiraceae bacterium]|nr:Hsp20/alpha crystallin family protein [Ectothiorhodospiraceae bacterium]
MSTFEQLKHGLEHAWDQLGEGWRALRERAGQALTRFHVEKEPARELDTVSEQRLRRGSRWGLLAAELLETDDQLEVRLEIPGMNREDFEITVREQILVVRGRKSVARDQRRGNYLISERAFGAFERALPLPAPVDESRAEARYQDGVLTVRLPKEPAARQRRIPVETR